MWGLSRKVFSWLQSIIGRILVLDEFIVIKVEEFIQGIAATALQAILTPDRGELGIDANGRS